MRYGHFSNCWSGVDSEGCYGYHWTTTWLSQLISPQYPIWWSLDVYASMQVYCGLIYPTIGKQWESENDISWKIGKKLAIWCEFGCHGNNISLSKYNIWILHTIKYRNTCFKQSYISISCLDMDIFIFNAGWVWIVKVAIDTIE